MPKPLTDLVAFLTGQTADDLALGPARFVVVLVFFLLVAVSLLLVVVNLRDERAQRSGRLLWRWLARLVVGLAWFKVMLDTLPIGPDNALHGWLATAATRSAVPEIARLAADRLLPSFALVNPLAFLGLFLIATSFILGLLVRPAGLAAFALTVAAWLGLYGDPGIWFWGFPFLALLCGTACVDAHGRALGADAWLRRAVPSVRDGRGLGRLLRALT